MDSRCLPIRLGEKSYDILFGRGLLKDLGSKVRPFCAGGRAFLLTDQNVDALYGATAENSLREAGMRVRRLALPAGEQTKRFDTLPEIYRAMSDFHLTRADLVLTLGGGVIGDLGGFAAATFLRGLPFVQVPTSLLAQVDSSVGGKVAVDMPWGKNLVGAFHQPKLVLIDPDVLQTLPPRVFRDGMGEVIKYGFLFDPALLDILQDPDRIEEVLFRSCDWKRRVVETDERDRGERMLLNFGHTVGHAIEASQNFSGFTHGEAVGLGMLAITRLAQARGLTEPGTAKAIAARLAQIGLPVRAGALDWEKVRAALQNDKKNLGDHLTVVLVRRVGEGYLYTTNREFFEGVEQCLA